MRKRNVNVRCLSRHSASRAAFKRSGAGVLASIVQPRVAARKRRCHASGGMRSKFCRCHASGSMRSKFSRHAFATRGTLFRPLPQPVLRGQRPLRQRRQAAACSSSHTTALLPLRHRVEAIIDRRVLQRRQVATFTSLPPLSPLLLFPRSPSSVCPLDVRAHFTCGRAP